MIRLTNMGCMVSGDFAMTSAELTMLLNKHYYSFDSEEDGLTSLRNIAEMAVSDEPVSPVFLRPIEIDVSFIGGFKLNGNKGDIERAIGYVSQVMLKDFASHESDEVAREWFAELGRLAVMTDEELSDTCAEVMN